MSVTIGLVYNREEQKRRVFENMVLRRKLGPKREQLKMTEKIYKEELHDVYSLTNIFHVFK